MESDGYRKDKEMKRLPSRSLKIAAAGAAAVVLGAGGGVAAYEVDSGTATQTVVRQVTVTDSQPASSSALSVSALYDRVHQGVVTIKVTTPEGQALGSGFVIDSEGHIVTNDHVVDGASSISVEFPDGSTYDAQLVGTDASTDIGVIKVAAPSSELTPLQLGDSSALQVGDEVVAIGSPLGLNETVTSGIVSALNRTITSPNNFSINDAIQTDAAINHGNSGGPLLDLQGQVIGINSQIESDSGGNDGIGFAVPSNTVKSVVSQLIATGQVQHAYLGVGIATITDALSSQLGLPAGVEVTQVTSGGPAADAGLKAADATTVVGGQEFPTGGDVITAVDGKSVSTSEELQSVIGAMKPGDSASITYSRDGSEHTVQVTLGTRPS
jgi:S1-C subfamily serine protease